MRCGLVTSEVHEKGGGRYGTGAQSVKELSRFFISNGDPLLCCEEWTKITLSSAKDGHLAT